MAIHQVVYQSKVFRLEGKSWVIGRQQGPENISIDDEALSKKHALLVPHLDSYKLIDFKSLNGIQFNGRLIEEVVLNPGDRFTLAGKHELVYQRHEDTPSTGWPRKGPDLAGARRRIEEPALSAKAFTTIVDVRDFEEYSEVPLESVPGTVEEAMDQIKAWRACAVQVLRIHAAKDLDSLLETVADICLAVLGADRFYARLRAPEDSAPIHTVHRGYRDIADRQHRAPIIDALIDLCTAEGAPVVIRDTLDPKRLPGLGVAVRIADLRSSLCAPIMSDTTPIGFLYADTNMVGSTFGERERDLVRTLAAHTSLVASRLEG